MRYFGGKERISKDLTEFINKNFLKGTNRPFYDLFCGSCNVLTKIDKDRELYGNDKHKYVISMWMELQNGWIPPKSCSEEQYHKVKQNLDIKPYVSGFIGFGCSFGGKWWGGYAKSNENRNYCLNAFNSTMNKLKNLKDVMFTNCDYKDVHIKNNSVVYCDIPYKNTTKYSTKEVGEFDHDEFYSWCIQNKNNFSILISEYKHNVPDGFAIIWEKESKQDIRSKDGRKKNTVEVLITPMNN